FFFFFKKKKKKKKAIPLNEYDEVVDHLHTTSLDGNEFEGEQIQPRQVRYEHKFVIVGPPPDLSTFESSEHLEVYTASALLKKITELKHTSKQPIWVDMSCDRETFLTIAESIRPKIHPLTIEDCVSKDCREKLEIFDQYLFICIRAPTHDRERTQRIAIIVFKTLLLTYHELPAVIMDNTRKIIKKRHFPGLTPKWSCPSPGWVCHAIVDGVIDALIPDVNRVVSEVENLEKLVSMIGINSQHELLRRFQNGRAALGVYRHRLWPKSILVDHLNNLEWRAFLRDVPAPYWRDINDHLAKMVEVIEIGMQTLESLQNVFVAKVSVDMTRHSNHLSAIGAKLAALAAVFLPASFLAGVLGMNCWVPFQLSPPYTISPENAHFGFLAMCGLMILSSSFNNDNQKKKLFFFLGSYYFCIEALFFFVFSRYLHLLKIYSIFGKGVALYCSLVFCSLYKKNLASFHATHAVPILFCFGIVEIKFIFFHKKSLGIVVSITIFAEKKHLHFHFLCWR
ncbi:putative magnesium transporter, CorA-like protein, partial [Reticulomyxa filosa]